MSGRKIPARGLLIPGDGETMRVTWPEKVVAAAMRKAGKLAIARLVLSSREKVVTIAPRKKGMLVSTLRYPNEVRGTEAYFDTIPESMRGS
jgi:non-homologous end joining protein Ku